MTTIDGPSQLTFKPWIKRFPGQPGGQERSDREVLADMMDLGGTDARLLADKDFVELLIRAVRADYEAFNRYSCDPDVRISADIHVLGGSHDHRVDRDMLQRWETHTENVFTLLMFDGGHFYIDEHTNAVAELVSNG